MTILKRVICAYRRWRVQRELILNRREQIETIEAIRKAQAKHMPVRKLRDKNLKLTVQRLRIERQINGWGK